METTENHYQNDVITPMEIIEAYNLNFAEGNVIKYMLRWRKKNGVNDLIKARTYIDHLISKETDYTVVFNYRQ